MSSVKLAYAQKVEESIDVDLMDCRNVGNIILGYVDEYSISITYVPIGIDQEEAYETMTFTANTIEKLYDQIEDALDIAEPYASKEVLNSLMKYNFITIDPYAEELYGDRQLLFAHTVEELKNEWDLQAGSI